MIVLSFYGKTFVLCFTNPGFICRRSLQHWNYHDDVLMNDDHDEDHDHDDGDVLTYRDDVKCVPKQIHMSFGVGDPENLLY